MNVGFKEALNCRNPVALRKISKCVALSLTIHLIESPALWGFYNEKTVYPFNGLYRLWSRRRGSNPRPRRPERRALPTALRLVISFAVELYALTCLYYTILK